MQRTRIGGIQCRAKWVTTAAMIAIGTAAAAGVAHAQNQRLYAGVTGIASELSTSVDKRVDTRSPNTLVPEPRRGQLLHDQATGSVVSYGPGLLAGYRHPLIDNTLYVAVEADVAFDNEEVGSEFQGVGESAGRNQLGESWPDRWFYDSDQNVGVSVRLGFLAGPLRTWNASFYALIGLRRINGTFSTHFNGCRSPTPCSSSPDTPNFVSGTDSRDLDFEGSMFALGFERLVRQRVAVRLELRSTQYDDQSWVAPFDDVGVTAPTAVGTKQIGLMASMARTF